MADGRSYGGESAEDRRGRRRRALLDAGLELFGTRAYDDVSVADVLALSGQTRRAFYEGFADREALLRAVHDELLAQQLAWLAEAAGPALAEPASAAAAERALRANVTWYREDRRRAQVQFVAVVGVSPAIEQMRREAVRALADSFGGWAGKRAGTDPAARRRAMVAFFGGFSELLVDWLWFQDSALEELVEELVRTMRLRFFPAGG